MKKICKLGRIIFLSIFPVFLFANVNATLDKIAVLQGDTATLTISSTGKDIKFPQLQTIEGFDIVNTSQSSSIQIINGSITRNKAISYTFMPKQTLTIPSYKVIVDGVEQLTKSMNLKVIQPSASKAGDDLQLQLKLSKNKSYVGEAIIASIYFKYKVGMPLIDVQLEELKIKHFIIKQLKASKPYEENGYIVIKQDFILTPQLAGKYDIHKQSIVVALREARTNMIKRQKIFSNDENVEILALPNGIDVQGEFKIDAKVDKLSTKSNSPINLTLKIYGFGNIDDIDEFNIDLENEVVYSSKPTINSYIKDGKYGGSFTQKISIIADRDFTIPSISFKYFDKNSKTVKTIKTKPFDIKVSGVKNTNPNIQTNTKQNTKNIQIKEKIVYKKEDSYIKYLFAIIGLFAGIALASFALRDKNTKKEDISLVKKIKKAKNDIALYNILLPYSNNIKIVSIIKELEENIYNKKSNKMNKKLLLDIIKEENIK